MSVTAAHDSRVDTDADAAAARPAAAPESSAGGPVVVFDCDNTLIAGDVLKSFIVELVGHGPRLVAAVASVPVLSPLLLAHTTRRHAISGWLWIATVGRSDDELARRMDAYVEEHLGPGGDALIAAGVARVGEHVERGDRVVVATAAADPLARRLLDRAGLGGLAVVASPVRRVLGGWTLVVHCWGPFKPTQLAAAGFPGPYAGAYSDSFVDLPLLRLAGTATVVNPSRLVAWRLRRALLDLVDVAWEH